MNLTIKISLNDFNIINIECDENDNIREWKNHIYTSKSGKNHFGFVLSHLNDELNQHGGRLVDIAIKENDTIRNIIGYSHQTTYPSIKDNSNFVLDFDIDCFSTVCMGKRFAWPEDIFLQEYGPSSMACFLMKELIHKCKFITICREPSYFGGIGEANKILGYLDRYLFNGCLGSHQTK